MEPTRREELRQATRVTNPGCYSTGFLSIVRPLVRAGLVPADWPVLCNAVSGYSGGGKAMIAEFEDTRAPNYSREVFHTYGLGLEHKHVDEMQKHADLKQPRLFGRVSDGSIAALVEIPRHVRTVWTPEREKIHAALAEFVRGRS